jgi:hypothetical protein
MKMGSEGHSEHASLERVSYIGLGGLGMVIGDDNLAPGHRARTVYSVFLIYSGHDKVNTKN